MYAYKYIYRPFHLAYLIKGAILVLGAARAPPHGTCRHDLCHAWLYMSNRGSNRFYPVCPTGLPTGPYEGAIYYGTYKCTHIIISIIIYITFMAQSKPAGGRVSRCINESKKEVEEDHSKMPVHVHI